MHWLIALPTGTEPLFRTADDRWIADVTLAQRFSDAERARIEVPNDPGEPRWVWLAAPESVLAS